MIFQDGDKLIFSRPIPYSVSWSGEASKRPATREDLDAAGISKDLDPKDFIVVSRVIGRTG